MVLDLALARPPRLGGARLVCLDGPAGSGKTTLAAGLARCARELGHPAPVVHLDDLYDGWGGLDGVVDQLETLLRPLAAGRPGHYRRHDWHTGTWAEDVAVEPPGDGALLVLEGVGSGAARSADLVSLLVWLDAPAGLRRRRALARDGETFAPHWDRWARDERRVHARDRTPERADLHLGAGPPPTAEDGP